MTDASGNNPGTTGDYKGAVFHPEALGLAMMQDLKIETQRDASLRADEIVATAVYGVAELNDTNGCEIESDSSIQQQDNYKGEKSPLYEIGENYGHKINKWQKNNY